MIDIAVVGTVAVLAYAALVVGAMMACREKWGRPHVSRPEPEPGSLFLPLGARSGKEAGLDAVVEKDAAERDGENTPIEENDPSDSASDEGAPAEEDAN